MKIAVIVVTYNGMKWYKKCFDSIQNSSIPLQTIVIDNKSSDNTVEYIKNNYPEIHLIESSKNLGFGKANNIGIRYAIDNDADYVFLLNQDAWVKPDAVEKLAVKMNEFPEYGILSPIHINGNQEKLDFAFQYYIMPDQCPHFISDAIVEGKPYDKIYPIKFVNAAIWLISRKCLETIGGFNPIFQLYGEDDNYVCRLEYHGYKIGIYPDSWGIHDRDFEEREKRATFSKIRKRKLISYLVVLTDIQVPLFITTVRTFSNILIKCFKDLFSFSFKEIVINISSIINIVLLLPSIYKNRNISKKKGLTFLN